MEEDGERDADVGVDDEEETEDEVETVDEIILAKGTDE